MAAARKLNAEVAQCLKKVQDGLEDFDNLWERVENSTSQNQRDKFTEELKKELNKLQRLRNSIKNWQSESDVKDKDKLAEYRRKIEENMERFSIFEKDSKRKAFSTQALSMDDELDEEEVERQRHRDWISGSLQRIQDEIDGFDVEFESLSRGKKKGNKNNSRKEIESFKRTPYLAFEQVGAGFEGA